MGQDHQLFEEAERAVSQMFYFIGELWRESEGIQSASPVFGNSCKAYEDDSYSYQSAPTPSAHASNNQAKIEQIKADIQELLVKLKIKIHPDLLKVLYRIQHNAREIQRLHQMEHAHADKIKIIRAEEENCEQLLKKIERAIQAGSGDLDFKSHPGGLESKVGSMFTGSAAAARPKRNLPNYMVGIWQFVDEPQYRVKTKAEEAQSMLESQSKKPNYLEQVYRGSAHRPGHYYRPYDPRQYKQPPYDS